MFCRGVINRTERSHAVDHGIRTISLYACVDIFVHSVGYVGGLPTLCWLMFAGGLWFALYAQLWIRRYSMTVVVEATARPLVQPMRSGHGSLGLVFQARCRWWHVVARHCSPFPWSYCRLRIPPTWCDVKRLILSARVKETVAAGGVGRGASSPALMWSTLCVDSFGLSHWVKISLSPMSCRYTCCLFFSLLFVCACVACFLRVCVIIYLRVRGEHVRHICGPEVPGIPGLESRSPPCPSTTTCSSCSIIGTAFLAASDPGSCLIDQPHNKTECVLRKSFEEL